MYLLPLLALQVRWAGAKGLSGFPGIKWSACISLRSVKACLQMWQWVAVSRTTLARAGYPPP
jgi:hypothetical protein